MKASQVLKVVAVAAGSVAVGVVLGKVIFILTNQRKIERLHKLQTLVSVSNEIEKFSETKTDKNEKELIKKLQLKILELGIEPKAETPQKMSIAK